jgi:hypothetical protein
MLLKDIIAGSLSESHKRHKYKTQHYWMLKQMVYIITTRF